MMDVLHWWEGKENQLKKIMDIVMRRVELEINLDLNLVQRPCDLQSISNCVETKVREGMHRALEGLAATLINEKIAKHKLQYVADNIAKDVGNHIYDKLRGYEANITKSIIPRVEDRIANPGVPYTPADIPEHKLLNLSGDRKHFAEIVAAIVEELRDRYRSSGADLSRKDAEAYIRVRVVDYLVIRTSAEMVDPIISNMDDLIEAGVELSL